MGTAEFSDGLDDLRVPAVRLVFEAMKLAYRAGDYRAMADCFAKIVDRIPDNAEEERRRFKARRAELKALNEQLTPEEVDEFLRGMNRLRELQQIARDRLEGRAAKPRRESPPPKQIADGSTLDGYQRIV